MTRPAPPRDGAPTDVKGPTRLFVAVTPSVAALTQVRRVQDGLRRSCREAGCRASFPPAANLHLTLRFLGDVAASQVNPIGRALLSIGRAPAFQIALSGIGAFPGEKKPRILWLGVTEGADRLKSLAEQVDRCFAPLGIAPEQREFRAHLTLARVKRASGSAVSVINPVSPQGPIPSPVSEVVLYRSDLLPSGARYTPLVRVPLGSEVDGD